MITKKELSETAISSINLAIEKPESWFLSDDDNARLYAIGIGLNVMSTVRAIADMTVEGEVKSIKDMVGLLKTLKNKHKYPINDEMTADIVKVVKNRIKAREEKITNNNDMDFTKKVRIALNKIEESRTPKHPFELFGIEHCYGWYGLTLPIIEEVRKYNELHPDNEIHIDQIKEKFGTLRIYLSHEPDYLHKMICKAGHESGYICEICGARGSNKEINGWYMTLCDEHRKAKLEAKGDHELENKLYKNMLNIENYGWKTYGSKAENNEDSKEEGEE